MSDAPGGTHSNLGNLFLVSVDDSTVQTEAEVASFLPWVVIACVFMPEQIGGLT